MYIFLRSIFVYTVASDNCNKRQLTYLLTSMHMEIILHSFSKYAYGNYFERVRSR